MFGCFDRLIVLVLLFSSFCSLFCFSKQVNMLTFQLSCTALAFAMLCPALRSINTGCAGLDYLCNKLFIKPQINQGNKEFSTVYSAVFNCRLTALTQLCSQWLKPASHRPPPAPIGTQRCAPSTNRNAALRPYLHLYLARRVIITFSLCVFSWRALWHVDGGWSTVYFLQHSTGMLVALNLL